MRKGGPPPFGGRYMWTSLPRSLWVVPHAGQSLPCLWVVRYARRNLASPKGRRPLAKPPIPRPMRLTSR